MTTTPEPDTYPPLPDHEHLLGWCPVREDERVPTMRDFHVVNLRALSVVGAYVNGDEDEAVRLMPNCTGEADMITDAMARMAADLIRTANPRDPSSVVAALRTRILRAQS
jgi:hypothetical protein